MSISVCCDKDRRATTRLKLFLFTQGAQGTPHEYNWRFKEASPIEYLDG